MVTRTGDREIGAVSGRLPDNPGELACMRKQEKNSLVRAFRMMPVNRIATIYDVDRSLLGMLCSLPFRFRNLAFSYN